jgi:hypothetical protein
VRLAAPITPRLEGDAERVRRAHDQAIREMQQLPAAATRIIADVDLADGVTTQIAHGLGRAPKIILHSPPRGPVTSGRIEEVRDGIDRTKYVALAANGFGATVTVDVEVK